MFGLCPSAPTRPEDYAARRVGRPLRNARVKPRGLTPRRIAQRAGRRAAGRVTPDPRICEPALVLTDIVAGQQPWMGILLDPSRSQPVPIGSLIRSAGPEPARYWLVWPDGRLRRPRGLTGTDPQSVAAYVDEPAMAHFARELDEAAAEAALAEQGEGPVDVHVTAYAVAGGYGVDNAAADAVTAWIAETIRREVAQANGRAVVPRALGDRNGNRRTQREVVCRWLRSANRVAVITGRQRCSSSPAPAASEHADTHRPTSRPPNALPASSTPPTSPRRKVARLHERLTADPPARSRPGPNASATSHTAETVTFTHVCRPAAAAAPVPPPSHPEDNP